MEQPQDATQDLNEDDYIVLDEPSWAPPICPVLLTPILDPYLSDCCTRRWYSKKVLDENLDPCPMCREPFVLKPDNELKEKIHSLRVQCSKPGCHWIGGLNEIPAHLGEQCAFVPVKCPICKADVERGKVEFHQTKDCPKRTFSCSYCSTTSTYEDITSNHLPQCAEKAVPCPNNCGNEPIPHKRLKEHVEQCPRTTVKCEYSSIGCEYGTSRDKQHLMTLHMDAMVSEHRALLVKRFQLLCKQLSTLQQDNQLLRTRYHHYIEQVFSHLECTMDDFYKHYSSWCSEPFYSHVGGYKMCLKASGSKPENGSGHLDVGVCVMKGEFDQELEFPFNGCVTVQLVQVNEQRLQNCVEKMYTFDKQSAASIADQDGLLVQQRFITLKELHSISTNKSITSLKFRIADITAPSSFRCIGVDPQFSKLQDHLSHYPNIVEECEYCYRGWDVARGDLSKMAARKRILSIIADGLRCGELHIKVLKGQNCMLRSLDRSPNSVYNKTPEFIMRFFEYYYKNNLEWISYAFYTHYGGYRLCLNVEGRGSDIFEGKYLCVLVRLCAGDFDGELSFPFSGEIKVQLVDHGPRKKHVEKVISIREPMRKEIADRVTALTDVRNEKHYDPDCRKFIAFEDLRNSSLVSYLVNNSLTFRVTNVVVNTGAKPAYVIPQQPAQILTLLYLGMLTHEEIAAELLKDYPRYKVSRHGLVDSLIARFIIYFIGKGRI